MLPVTRIGRAEPLHRAHAGSNARHAAVVAGESTLMRTRELQPVANITAAIAKPSAHLRLT